jgi:hypothetical protein
MGKYSPITSVIIQFTQTDLHHLASGDIDIVELYLTGDHEELAIDPVNLICRGTQELLVDACTRTSNLTRLPQLVNGMTYSWRDIKDTKCRIRNAAHLTTSLEHCIQHNLTELVICAHCDLLFFDPNFVGLNLNLVNTIPIPPSPVTASTTAATTPLGTTIGTRPSVTPPTDIFNYHALPTDVMRHFDAFQDPNIILRVQDMTPFTLPDGTQHNYYTNPTVIGSRVILRNGAVLEA